MTKQPKISTILIKMELILLLQSICWILSLRRALPLAAVSYSQLAFGDRAKFHQFNFLKCWHDLPSCFQPACAWGTSFFLFLFFFCFNRQIFNHWQPDFSANSPNSFCCKLFLLISPIFLSKIIKSYNYWLSHGCSNFIWPLEMASLILTQRFSVIFSTSQGEAVLWIKAPTMSLPPFHNSLLFWGVNCHKILFAKFQEASLHAFKEFIFQSEEQLETSINLVFWCTVLEIIMPLASALSAGFLTGLSNTREFISEVQPAFCKIWVHC